MAVDPARVSTACADAAHKAQDANVYNFSLVTYKNCSKSWRDRNEDDACDSQDQMLVVGDWNALMS